VDLTILGSGGCMVIPKPLCRAIQGQFDNMQFAYDGMRVRV